MNYGMRIWGGDGTLQVDETSFTCRVVLAALVTFAAGAPKGTQDFSVPGCNPSNSVAFIIPEDNNYDLNYSCQFETEMLGDVARVYNYTRTFATSYTASGTQRLVVVRFN
jgi:hypothetical protein